MKKKMAAAEERGEGWAKFWASSYNVEQFLGWEDTRKRANKWRLWLCSLLRYLEAYEEGEGHGDQDEQPAQDGQDPSAHSDPRVAVVSCFENMKETKRKKAKINKRSDASLAILPPQRIMYT